MRGIPYTDRDKIPRGILWEAVIILKINFERNCQGPATHEWKCQHKINNY